MIREWTDRLSRWYNSQNGDRQVFLFIGFCLLFLIILWVSITYLNFDVQVYQSAVPVHIGSPSGILTDSINTNK